LPAAVLEIDKEPTTKLTEVEQQKRLHIEELLVPHFGNNVQELIDAAISVQEPISAHTR
jgi:hypothetical protein